MYWHRVILQKCYGKTSLAFLSKTDRFSVTWGSRPAVANYGWQADTISTLFPPLCLLNFLFFLRKPFLRGCTLSIHSPKNIKYLLVQKYAISFNLMHFGNVASGSYPPQVLWRVCRLCFCLTARLPRVCNAMKNWFLCPNRFLFFFCSLGPVLCCWLSCFTLCFSHSFVARH